MNGLLSALNSGNALNGTMTNPGDWFAGFGLLEVVDLILLTVILLGLGFYLMRRRAGKMILGGLYVTVLLAVAVALGLPILSAFAEAIFSIFLLVILLLYHEEIRDILRQIGCFPERIFYFFKKHSAHGISKKTATVIEEVCDAAVQMSLQHTGALIVLKRAGGLREYTSKGRVMNAEVSSALIRTVFYTGSPLHDGAMIIENGRIRAAACQLPPADPQGLDDSLGERHKAAIGISECTDAVALVVSEETGTISIALGNGMKRGYNREELYAELELLLGNYNTRLDDWNEGSQILSSSDLKQKKPAKEDKNANREDG